MHSRRPVQLASGSAPIGRSAGATQGVLGHLRTKRALSNCARRSANNGGARVPARRGATTNTMSGAPAASRLLAGSGSTWPDE